MVVMRNKLQDPGEALRGFCMWGSVCVTRVLFCGAFSLRRKPWLRTSALTGSVRTLPFLLKLKAKENGKRRLGLEL